MSSGRRWGPATAPWTRPAGRRTASNCERAVAALRLMGQESFTAAAPRLSRPARGGRRGHRGGLRLVDEALDGRAQDR